MLSDDKDLIYEGIATRTDFPLGCAFHRDDKDLIYEGIATKHRCQLGCVNFHFLGRQRPDLRRDCDIMIDDHFTKRSIDDKDLIYEGIATGRNRRRLPGLRRTTKT